MWLLSIFAVPFVCGAVGWITNYLAVKMIFRPRRPVRILGFTLIGLIPKRRSDLAQKIAETVERELISHRDVEEALRGADVHEAIAASIRGRIDDFLAETAGANPLLGLFLQGQTAQGIKDVLCTKIEAEIPAMLETLMARVQTKLDFTRIVRQKIEAFELAKLETIIYSIASRELKAIEVWGGVLGFIVGLAQTLLLLIGSHHG